MFQTNRNERYVERVFFVMRIAFTSYSQGARPNKKWFRSTHPTEKV